MRLIRTLARRKLRTGLTIAGIAIGIWALVVFSSMANKISALVEGGSRYYADKIVVSDASISGFGGLPMRLSAAQTIRGLDGVAAVVPQVSLFTEAPTAGASIGVHDQIVASVPGADLGLDDFAPRVAQGRTLEATDEGTHVAILGADLARKYAASIGSTVTVRGQGFEVVGILEPTLSAPDSQIVVPFAAGQDLFYAELPPLIRENVRSSDIASGFIVFPAPGADPAAIASAIRSRVENAQALTGAEFDQTVGSSIALFNAIILGVGLISLVVGGLSVINTMAMSVAERTREIGIKRAIGGSRARIVRELVIEAGFIGFVGGCIGLALGALVVIGANEAGRSSGTILFELTPTIAGACLVFSTVLGTLAGALPAWNGARLDPVAALRYE